MPELPDVEVYLDALRSRIRMITGRLHWKPRGAKIQGRIGLAAFDFPAGT